MILRKFAKDNFDKVDWKFLSQNPNAIELLEQNLEKIDFNTFLVENPNAIELIKKNLNKINIYGCGEVYLVTLMP